MFIGTHEPKLNQFRDEKKFLVLINVHAAKKQCRIKDIPLAGWRTRQKRSLLNGLGAAIKYVYANRQRSGIEEVDIGIR